MNDPSLAAFEASSGKCVARRMLPYAPTSLLRVRSMQAESDADSAVCPSEMTFVVGGGEGQVEVFRLVVLSGQKLELHFVTRISDRVRGKNRGVLQTFYAGDEAVLVGMTECGEIRRWELSHDDGCSLCFTESERNIKPLFTEGNVKDALKKDLSLDESARVTSVAGIMKAHSILARILDDDSISEERKDELVTEFQRKQADMLVTISQTDAELRRARRRIMGRFEFGLKIGDDAKSLTERQLCIACKRTAAFELERGTRMHGHKLGEIQRAAVGNLKITLQSFLKSVPSTSSGIQRAVEESASL